jgi:hypothetical protein
MYFIQLILVVNLLNYFLLLFDYNKEENVVNE